MGKNYFTQEQVEQLRKNKYVKHVSEKSITYNKEFKETFMLEYNNSVWRMFKYCVSCFYYFNCRHC